MKTVLVLLFGLALGGAGMWFYLTHRDDPALQRLGEHVGHAGDDVREAAQDRLQRLQLRSGDLQDELARTGQIVRRAAQDAGRAMADATADARITAAIKARYIADSRLSALRISVNCTEGRVTLAGTVASMEDIGHAMLLAMETEGVREVVSTLQIKP
jgi:osmotically-inducible protein OsmY